MNNQKLFSVVFLDGNPSPNPLLDSDREPYRCNFHGFRFINIQMVNAEMDPDGSSSHHEKDPDPKIK